MSAIILASTSPYRRELLHRLGLTFDSVAPGCDEEALKDPADAPRELAERLAEAKATSVAVDHPTAIVIGSDQVACLDAETLGKPGTRERARAQLEAMAGRRHHLITAVAVCHRGAIHRHTDITALDMRPLDAAAIERYLDRDQPLDCAGAYKLEAAGIALFARIESADHTAITGLPLIALTTILRACGVLIP